jgi:hypothetical protein
MSRKIVQLVAGSACSPVQLAPSTVDDVNSPEWNEDVLDFDRVYALCDDGSFRRRHLAAVARHSAGRLSILVPRSSEAASTPQPRGFDPGKSRHLRHLRQKGAQSNGFS